MLRIVVLLAAFLVTGTASADDWVASKLRGNVFVGDGQQWAPLKRGDGVPNGKSVRTLAGGNVELARGTETIRVAPYSQIQIIETQGGHYTRVEQPFGKITIADNHTSTPHFEVDTPFMVSVVKGTVFTVKSDAKGSRVDVMEGAVQVTDSQTNSTATITAGQNASVGAQQPLAVGGTAKGKGVGHHIGDSAPGSSGTDDGSDVVTGDDTPAQSEVKSDNGNGNGGTPGNGGQNTHGNGGNSGH